MIKIGLLLLLSCAANLDVDDSDIIISEDPEPPPTLGINIEDDCDKTALGSKVCNLILLDQNGEYWKLYDHAGKVIILDFSTAWCGPCQVAGHRTQPIQDDYGDQIVFVTILIEGTTGLPATQEDLDTWVTEHAITSAPVLQGSRDYVMDPAGITGYLVGGFPTYVYVDQDLKIHMGHVGFNEEYMRTTLNGLL